MQTTYPSIRPCLLSLLLLGFFSQLPLSLSAQSQPNILIFFVDDLGWTDLGCYGSDLYETPHIDRLAEEGVRFTEAYAACTVCSPSRAAVMTGQYPARLHLTDWIEGHKRPKAPLLPPDWTMYLPHEETTLAEHLQAAGYATAHVGKWHLGEDSSYWPQYQGFDLNIAGYNKGQPPSYFAPYEREGWPHIPHLAPGPRDEYLTYRLTTEANAFIESQADNPQPFFLYFAHYTVHTPLQAPDSLVAYYTDKIKAGLRHTNPTYAAMVHSLDQSIGSVRAQLEASGQWDNTLVIFASDNGGLAPKKKWNVTNNHPLRAGKGTAYEGGVRTPLIIRYPRAEGRGQETDQPTITMDIAATVLDAASLSPKAAQDGISLWSMRKSATAFRPDRALYWHYPHYHTQGATPYSAIRVGAYRLIEFYEDGRRELFNLKADVGETTDLLEDEPKMAKKLGRKLDRWRKKVGAQDPIVNAAAGANR